MKRGDIVERTVSLGGAHAVLVGVVVADSDADMTDVRWFTESNVAGHFISGKWMTAFLTKIGEIDES